MNGEVITLESDDELHCTNLENGSGTATASILNEKPLNIKSLLGPACSVSNVNFVSFTE